MNHNHVRITDPTDTITKNVIVDPYPDNLHIRIDPNKNTTIICDIDNEDTGVEYIKADLVTALLKPLILEQERKASVIIRELQTISNILDKKSGIDKINATTKDT